MFESIMQYNISPNNPSDLKGNDNRDSRIKFMSKDRDYFINEEIYTCSSSYFNFEEDMECVEECSSQSWISCSEDELSETIKDKNCVLRCTREKLTRDWVRRTFAENFNSNSFFESTFACNISASDSEYHFTDTVSDNKEKSYFSNSETEDDANMSEPETKMDNSVAFAKDETKEIECSLDSTISFLQVVTEESCKDGLSFSTRGSLSCFDFDEFCEEEEDIEFMWSSPSLSSVVLPDMSDKGESELSQSFDIDSFFDFKKVSKVLQDINDKWNNSMDDIEDKPRESTKVSFAPSEDLVTVHSFENTSEESFLNDSSILDQVRFKHRIKELETLLSPFLTPEHRAKFISRNNILK